MLTFARKLELINATWDEIDLDRGEWVIPAERMKMDKLHIIPLSRQGVECFEKLQPLARGSCLSRETLYRTLSKRGNPQLMSLTRILGATGLRLSVTHAPTGLPRSLRAGRAA